VNAQFDSTLTWDDIDWLRTCWDGPIVVKGIQSVADARIAADRGIEAIVISNHGGRQLDGAPATIDLVAPVVDAVGDRLEVLVDGGVRRGTDVLVALALGARAVLVGRPVLWGLAAGGEAGAAHVLEMLRSEVELGQVLLGASRPDSVVSHHVRGQGRG
jgi:isopentenyl diphosphate isomerase/L-lactate dehydrogenase-like FMN-dependent dehydrogenase